MHDTVQAQRLSVPLHIYKCPPITPGGSNCTHTTMCLCAHATLCLLGLQVCWLCVWPAPMLLPRTTEGAKDPPGSHRWSERGPQQVATLSCHASAAEQLSSEAKTPLEPEGGQDRGEMTWGSVTQELERWSVTSVFQGVSPITKCCASLFFQSKLFISHKFLAIVWLLFNLSNTNFMKNLSLVISSLEVSDLGHVVSE